MAMRNQEGLDVAFWVGLGLGLLIAWQRHFPHRCPTSSPASELDTLEAMWAATPHGTEREMMEPGAVAEQFECAGCGGLLDARAWRFCGWCGGVLGWPTRS